jgi:hypothetical protein
LEEARERVKKAATERLKLKIGKNESGLLAECNKSCKGGTCPKGKKCAGTLDRALDAKLKSDIICTLSTTKKPWDWWYDCRLIFCCKCMCCPE